MNKIKIFFTNLFYKLKSALFSLYQRSYGMDDFNKILVIVYFASAIINIFFRSIVINIIDSIFFLLFLFRYFSSNKIKRSEENRVFKKYIKFIKLKWQYRKTHKIFLCRCCKQIIRVPRRMGKIETTCPTCGNKKTLRT